MGKISKLTFKELEIEGYERVVEVFNESVGLHAIIAVHTTTLGPALGGIRVYPYKTMEEGLTDVLRLADGMSRKAAVAGTGTGGGKAVIFADSRAPKSKELLHAFGEAVNEFGGSYICAEDVGMRVEDVAVIHEVTESVVGLPETSGNPSLFTAWGTFRGVQAVCEQIFGNQSVGGKVVAIQGLGSVGLELAKHLFWGGAELIVADINAEAVAYAVKHLGARAVSVDEILTVECDILAPCALGGILDKETIPQLRCKGIAGATNNQLLTPEDGDLLFERGILYAPDYVINSGGLLNVLEEITPQGYNPVVARNKVDGIFDVLMRIFNISKERGMATNRVADEIAIQNLKHGIGKRTEKVVFHSKIS
ncbi:MAG: leucine dehydrogenase [Chlamydiales bacterium]|nr:leucine dehydrogenase [Chlamydiales bacterium]